MTSPRPRGFARLPEWHIHRAVWLAWPAHADEWRGELDAVRANVAELCRAIAAPDPLTGVVRGESIEVLVLDDACEADARQRLEIPVRFHRIPYGDIWLRDTGPLFLAQGAERAALAFGFNGWGGKYLFEHDAEVAGRIAAATATPLLERPALIAEGGGLEVDGAGACLTTRQCLLNDNRNPGLTEPEIETILRSALGVERVIWVDEGLQNDHTDGHIDTLVRFVGPGQVVAMEPRQGDDPNAHALRAIIAALEPHFEIVTIPSPGPILDRDGSVMPASYANFYIGNAAVVVPTYGSRYDDEAVAGIAACFPSRVTVGLDARAVLVGGGAFHCITQEQP